MREMLLFIFFLFAANNSAMAQQTMETNLTGKRVWRVPQIPLENNDIIYKGNVTLDGIAEEQLYNRAYYWLRQNLKSDDLQMRNNKKDGHIAGIGKIMYNQNVVKHNAAQGIYFDYDVWVKDGGYSYNISNLRAIVSGDKIDYAVMYREELIEGDKDRTWTHKYRYEMLSDMHSFITLFIAGLKGAMVEK